MKSVIFWIVCGILSLVIGLSDGTISEQKEVKLSTVAILITLGPASLLMSMISCTMHNAKDPCLFHCKNK